MSARIRRFGAFGSGSSRGKAAGAVIACGVMLLTACGGSVTGGGATDAPSVIVRGDTLGSDWATTPGLVSASSPSAGQVVVSWDKQVEEDPTEKVIGYVVQVTSIFVDHNGPWTGATTGCANSETQSSTTKTCTVTGLADGSYAFNVAAVRKNVLTKNTRTAVVSMPSNSVTLLSPPGIPATPTLVAGTGKVSVTVTAGTATDGTLGGVPASFTVTPTPAITTPPTCTFSGASVTCVFTGLANSTDYTFTATATNASSTVPSLPSAASDVVRQSRVGGVLVTHTVVFHLNGGPDSGGNASNQSGQSTTALSRNPFYWQSHMFIGWSATPTGPLAYSDGDDYAFTADADLYAMWACLPSAGRVPVMSISNVTRTGQESAKLDYQATTLLSSLWSTFTASTTVGGQSTTVSAEGINGVPANGQILVKGLRRQKGYDFTVTGTNYAGCSYTSFPVHVDKFD